VGDGVLGMAVDRSSNDDMMGLTLPHALKTMIKLHKNAIDSVHSIFRARRIREWQGPMDPP
jgi:hypothetical protein